MTGRATIRYLSHPQVTVDPDADVRRWSLNAEGRARVARLAARPGRLQGTALVVSSDEAKAVETAAPLADALGARHLIRPGTHENDRSATGPLPRAEFEATADRFFAAPDVSVRGWETARDAQARIVREVEAVLRDAPGGATGGDVLIVGHGGVGTLLWCALSRVAIDRRHDQGHDPGLQGGGNWFAFDTISGPPHGGWQPMETLSG